MTMAARTLPPASSNSPARVVADPGGVDDDAPGAVHQLLITRLHVHHQVAVDITQPDERSGREHVEDQFLRGAGLHAGGAGHDLGSGDGGDGDIDGAGELGIGRATDAGSDRAQSPGGGDGAEHVRSPSTGGDADQYILGGEATGGQVARAHFGVVFRSFGGAGERRFASSHDADHHVLGDAVSGGAFGGVEHAEASAGAGADVEETAAILEGGDDGVHRAGDVRDFARHGLGDLAVFIVDDTKDILRGKRIDSRGSGVRLFGEQFIERSHLLQTTPPRRPSSWWRGSFRYQVARLPRAASASNRGQRPPD